MVVFKKISYSPKKGVKLLWIDSSNDFSIESEDKPDPELFNSLQALSPSALLYCELPAEYLRFCETTGISFARSDNAEVTFCIVSRLALQRSPGHFLNLVTRHIPLLPGSAISNLVEIVCEQAQAFLDGRREQVDLFDKHE